MNVLDGNCTFSSWAGHIQPSCPRCLSHLESLANSWVQHGPIHPAIHPDSANEEVLLLNLLLNAKSSVYVVKMFTAMFAGLKRCTLVAHKILTSLKTCRSATQTTTLTRWSSRCEERLRESAERTSAENNKQECRRGEREKGKKS